VSGFVSFGSSRLRHVTGCELCCAPSEDHPRPARRAHGVPGPTSSMPLHCWSGVLNVRHPLRQELPTYMALSASLHGGMPECHLNLIPNRIQIRPNPNRSCFP
jgi:hypothetical protein